MGCCDPHWIVEHQGALQAPQAAACSRPFAPFYGPGLGGNIVGPKEDRRVLYVEVGAVVESAPIVYACGIVNKDGGILKAVDVNQLTAAAIADIPEGAVPDSLGPLKIPPKPHVSREASSSIKAGVAPCGGVWCVGDEVCNGCGLLDGWGGDGEFDEVQLMRHGLVNEELAPCLMYRTGRGRLRKQGDLGLKVSCWGMLYLF